MRLNKRAQFYLIFAIIVMGLVTGLLAMKNYSIKEDTSDIKRIKEDLQIESQQVMDYILITRNNVLNNFTQEFSNYAKGYEIIYIIDYDSNLEIYKYEQGVKNTDINYWNENPLKVEYAETNYTFSLKDGDDFYFIISKEENGEIHVETNSE